MNKKIENWLERNGIINYVLLDDDISFQFLVADNRKRFLSYCKRLFGEKAGYSYDSQKRIEKHFFKGFKVTINNY